MRILVYEFVTGGGLAGQPIPAGLAREGRAMLTAVVSDLTAAGHVVVCPTDARYRNLTAGECLELIEIGKAGPPPVLADLARSVEAVWVIAPETGGWLAALTSDVEALPVRLLGSSSQTVRAAADKVALARRLERMGVAYPMTVGVDGPASARQAAGALGYPVVVKPSLGAGAGGVSIVEGERGLAPAFETAERATSLGPSRLGHVLVQGYIAGVPASVSVLCDGVGRARVFGLHAQYFRRSAGGLRYVGGHTPLDHPMAEPAAAAALAVCRDWPGLRGYVGVDVILTGREPVVIEVNPRLTTAYLGLRASVGPAVNLGDRIQEAVEGRLPEPPVSVRRVRFTAGGDVRVVDAAPAERGTEGTLESSEEVA